MGYGQFATAFSMYSATAIAATANSGAVNMPQASSYMFILDVAAGTGTTPTLDIALQVTPDGGTTWYSVSRWAQVTTAAVKSYKMVRNALAIGEVGFVQAIADTGGAVDKDFLVTKTMRALATIGGTNPAWATLKIWCIPQPWGTGLGS